MKNTVFIASTVLFFCASFYVLFFIVYSSEIKYENKPISKESSDTEEIVEETEKNQNSTQNEEIDVFIPIRVETPKAVKSVYMTSCYAGTPYLRDALVKIIEETELNSVVIDIKDYTGRISFKSEYSDLEKAYSTHCPVKDMREFVYSLNEKGIYVIGRITVFQDSYLANLRPDLAVLRESDKKIWKDNKGLSFTDPSAKEVWDYHVLLAKEAYELGFDELNFDYIRFPSDGPMSDIYFPYSKDGNKADLLEQFFIYLHKELKDTGVVTSADLFGMTTSVKDDLGIGQVWEKALPNFDFLSPMVYPSHYPYGFKGLGNPNENIYEVVKWSLDDAVERTVAATTTVWTVGSDRVGTSTPAVYTKKVYDKKRIRPWIQDFRYGGPYTPEDVRLQIEAVYSSGLDSWMLWDPSNRYSPSALEPAI